MITEELLRYVEYQKNRGVDRSSIKMTLLQAGWTGDDINEAFKVVDSVSEADTNTVSDPSFDVQQPNQANPDRELGSQPNQISNPDQSEESLSPDPAQQLTQQNNEAFEQSNEPAQENASLSPSSTAKNEVVNDGQIPDQSNNPPNLKYRRAQDWQNEAAGMPPVVSAAVPQQPGAGSVYRPRINENYQSQNQPSRKSISETSLNTNPKQTLQQSKTKTRSSKKSLLLILLLLFIVGAAGAYWYLFIYTASPTYTAADVFDSFENVEYVQFGASGSLPLALPQTTNLPVGLTALGQDPAVSFELRGLFNTTNNYNGFGLSIDEVVFDYVYANQNFYAKFRDLPDTAGLSQYEGQWFDFSDESATRSLVGLVSNQPPNSLATVGSDLATVLANMYREGLVDITYLNSTNTNQGKVDSFSLEFDLSSLSSRLSSDSQFVVDLIGYTGLSEVSGIAEVYRDSKLLRQIELTAGSETIVVNFSYDYDGVEISAPADVVPATNIISAIENISGTEVVLIQDRLNLLASDVSVYREENQTLTQLCASEIVDELREYAQAELGQTLNCASNASQFAVSVSLPNPAYFACVDTSFAVVTNASAVAQNVVCGENLAYQPLETEITTESNESFFE